MTTGEIIQENRTTQTFNDVSCSGSLYPTKPIVGSYYRRYWSGGNATPSQKPKVTRWVYSYRVYRPNGSSYVRRRSVKIPNGPKRQPVGEHGYYLELTQKLETVCIAYDPCESWENERQTVTHFSTATLGQFQEIPWDANDDLAVIGRLRDKIQGEGFNLSVFLGEGREALQTIAESAYRINDALRYLRHGNVLAASNALLTSSRARLNPSGGSWRITERDAARKRVTEEWLASNWLQLQYGWKPLVQDCYAAAAHLAYMQNRPQVLKYRASKRKMSLTSPSPSYDLIGTNLRVKRIIALVTHINEAGLVGLTDPRSLLWEKLPWSFVVDWFIPIGNYLDSLALGGALTATYVTTDYRKARSVAAAYKNRNVDVNPFLHLDVFMTRVVSDTLDVPLPQLKTWDKVASFGHSLNALALLFGRTGPVKRANLG